LNFEVTVKDKVTNVLR